MLLRIAVAGGAGVIAGMFVGCIFWLMREPDRLIWAEVLCAGFLGGIVGALMPSKLVSSARGPAGSV